MHIVTCINVGIKKLTWLFVELFFCKFYDVLIESMVDLKPTPIA